MRALLEARQLDDALYDKLWKRELFEGIRFPVGRTYEDLATVYRLLLKAKRILCLPEPKYHYYRRKGSIMADPSLPNRMNHYRMAQQRYEELVKREFKKKYKGTVLGMIWSLLSPLLTLLVFLLFCAIDGICFTWKFFLLVYPVVCLLLLNVGVGLILSALYVFFRDMQYLWTVFAQLLMYASAIFYTTENFSPTLQGLLHLNPVYLCICYFRQIVLQGTVPPWWLHLLMLLFSGLSLGLGWAIYKKNNHKFLYCL